MEPRRAPQRREHLNGGQQSGAAIAAATDSNRSGRDEESKETERRNEEHPPRQSMSPLPASGGRAHSDSESLIKRNAVLIIPLDNRVTPQMVAAKFVRYGRILQVRPIRKSSTCIVIFSRASEAASCVRLFQSHDKVRVARPDQNDWNLCGESIAIPLPRNDSGSDREPSVDSLAAAAAIDAKMQSIESNQSRISIMYRQRAAFQLLHCEDEVARKKRVSTNSMMVGRLRAMHSTADEVHSYLRRMVDLETAYECNVEKAVSTTFGVHENGGSVHSAGIAIEALLRNRYEQFVDIKDRVFSKILVSAQKHRDALKKQSKSFEVRVRRLDGQCEAETVRLNMEWNRYQNVLHRTLKAQQSAADAAPSSKAAAAALPPSDPFLVGRSYDAIQRQYGEQLV